MSEKLFVIMEVEKIGVTGEYFCHENIHAYAPKDNISSVDIDGAGPEKLYLRPSHIIPASRLRYGAPKNEDTVFLDNFWDWTTNFNSHLQYLILDPEPEQDERDDWEKWADEGRELMDLESFPQKFEDWLKRMPRK